jgi:hypothetical protein
MEGVRSFAQRADLFLLRSGEAKDLVEYTVMLRQPGDVNIQDSSTVVRQDDLLMRGTVDEVTSRINRGLARAFEQGKSPAAPPAAEAPVAAEGPAVAPPVAAVPAGGEAPATAETDGLRDARRVSSPGGGAQGASEDVNDLADRYGGMMYRLFMPEQIQRYLADAPYSITLTTNELELPWELMRSDRSENKYLCLDRPVARMPTGHVSPNITDVARPGGKARFILIADPTQNLPGARREAEIIQQRLAEQWKDRIDITLLQGKDAQGARLNEVLYNGTYDVIHYAGHAAFDENNPERSALLLSGDEIFLAQKIRRLLRGRPLVFLNACESGKTANEQEQAPQVGYLQKPAAGLASSFIYGGAKGCIGSLWPVYDDSAAEFAVAFYGRVLDGHMIGEAMRQTRIEIRQRFPRQITWASFVLYGDPTQRIAYPSA